MGLTISVRPLITIFILVFASTKAVLAIRVEKVIVPPYVIAGKSVELQCIYKEERDELYSLKWWKGEEQFYQYIPPKRSYYSIPGVRVNMTATYSVNEFAPSGLERVVLETVGLDTAGVFKCEVMADKIFETVYREANMTVIVPPSGPPSITGYDRTHIPVINGQRISLMCSVPLATPQPKIEWKINNNNVRNVRHAEWITYHPVMYAGGLAQVVSSLDFVITQKIIDESIHGLVIECNTRQKESSYFQKDTLVLQPERSSYFWFFSHGSNCRYPTLWVFILTEAGYFLLLNSKF